MSANEEEPDLSDAGGVDDVVARLSPAKLAAVRLRVRENLYFFARYMFLARRGFKWRRNWHHEAICEALMRVAKGEVKRLIINVPPRYSKTELAVCNFIAWTLGFAPDAEFIHASYSARLATHNSMQARGLVQSEAYLRLFPKVKLSAEAKARSDWRTTAGGIVYATGAGGTITGFGAGKLRAGFGGAIIIDDPHKARESTSDLARQNVIDWYQNTMESRLNSPDTPVILIMQRLHENDLAGWLLSGGTGEAWEHLCLPVRDENGAVLWPEKHNAEALARMEVANPYVFEGQYMQRPTSLKGGIFKAAWWRFYRAAALPKIQRIVQSWDTSFKAGTMNDYSVCTTWAVTDGGYYLLECWKAKVEFPELKRIAVSLGERYGPHAILVEDKASGQSLIQELRRETRLPVVAVRPDADKVARAFAITPLIEGGRVYLPEGADWLAGYIASLAAFPNGAHDDDVDSTTQGLSYMARGAGSTGLLDYIAKFKAEPKP
jgi:predicted phage terminase large subunit-like protein